MSTFVSAVSCRNPVDHKGQEEIKKDDWSKWTNVQKV